MANERVTRARLPERGQDPPLLYDELLAAQAKAYRVGAGLAPALVSALPWQPRPDNCPVLCTKTIDTYAASNVYFLCRNLFLRQIKCYRASVFVVIEDRG